MAAADELARADVLRPGDPLGFTHPLVRAAIYGDLAFGERARTHPGAARLMVEAGFSRECVSSHLLEAAPDGDAVVVDYLRATAQRAVARGAPVSAVRYLERALREPPADAARRPCSPSSGERRRPPACRSARAPRGGDRSRR